MKKYTPIHSVLFAQRLPGLPIAEVRLLIDVSHHWVVRSSAVREEVCAESNSQEAAKGQLYLHGIACGSISQLQQWWEHLPQDRHGFRYNVNLGWSPNHCVMISLCLSFLILVLM